MVHRFNQLFNVVFGIRAFSVETSFVVSVQLVQFIQFFCGFISNCMRFIKNLWFTYDWLKNTKFKCSPHLAYPLIYIRVFSVVNCLFINWCRVQFHLTAFFVESLRCPSVPMYLERCVVLKRLSYSNRTYDVCDDYKARA